MKGVTNMLSNNYAKDLLNFQGVKIIKIEHRSSQIMIYTQLEVKTHKCPCCGCETSHIHDYYVRKIKDISAFGKHVIIPTMQVYYYACVNALKKISENISATIFVLFHIMCNINILKVCNCSLCNDRPFRHSICR